VLDARRQRITTSDAQVPLIKSSCLVVQALCTLLIIGIIHSDNWRATAIAMGTFATGLRPKPQTDRENASPFLEEVHDSQQWRSCAAFDGRRCHFQKAQGGIKGTHTGADQRMDFAATPRIYFRRIGTANDFAGF
jgi:hypothetical protein